MCDHIYVCLFRDEFILLDTKRDKYTICSQQFTELLRDVIEVELIDPNQNLAQVSVRSSQDLDNIQKLIDGKIIEKKGTPYPFYIDRKISSDGVSNVDWRLPLNSKKVKLNSSALKALMTLLKVNFYIRIKGFYSTIQLIKQSQKTQLNYIIPQDEDLKNLASTVNKACLIYPTRTKCLEWAITFVLLALKQKWKCNLEIGVQNYPFLAHAWAECNGQVIMDSQDLKKGLAIILNEPFRKSKA